MLHASVLVALKKTCTHCGTQYYPRCRFCEYCKAEFPKRASKPIKQIKHAYKVWACLRQKVHICVFSYYTCMCVCLKDSKTYSGELHGKALISINNLILSIQKNIALLEVSWGNYLQLMLYYGLSTCPSLPAVCSIICFSWWFFNYNIIHIMLASPSLGNF